MYIDVHCHIETFRDIKEVIERAKQAGVSIIINNSVDLKSMKKTLSLIDWYGEVKAALGVYPIETLKLNSEELDKIIDYIRKNKEKVFAIGEVGIDLKWNNDFERQKEAFIKFINLSKELDKPLIIHSRKAEEQVINILEENNCKKVIMHCFTGNTSLIERIIKNSWLLSIPTNVVSNSQIQDNVKRIPIQNLLCETDSPYFHPFNKKRNEPCFVVESYRKIAEIKGLELVEVEEQIEDNFKKLFFT